jgi:hypothetical protein
MNVAAARSLEGMLSVGVPLGLAKRCLKTIAAANKQAKLPREPSVLVEMAHQLRLAREYAVLHQEYDLAATLEYAASVCYERAASAAQQNRALVAFYPQWTRAYQQARWWCRVYRQPDEYRRTMESVLNCNC